MSFAALHIAALVDSIESLFLTAAQLDAAELSTASNGHEQLWQACWAGGVAHGHHGLEADVVAGHQLAWDHWFQHKPILISLDLQQNLHNLEEELQTHNHQSVPAAELTLARGGAARPTSKVRSAHLQNTRAGLPLLCSETTL
ncbi:MAG: hypothetical protein FRX49_10616 [Trebouxia sp. A1-2]|nr:MAG: hypothetical protein FRX49_10616 [Trebouxia sp. A1-2]